MIAKQAWVITALLFVICSCGTKNNPYGTNGTYGMMNNEREFGTVVTVSQGVSPVDVAGAKAKEAASALYNSSSSDVMSQNEAVTLHYVVRKDNGQVFALDQVPEDNEPINYPGSRVMIQKNGDFVRVYQANAENPLDYGQSDSSSPRPGYNSGPAMHNRHR